MNAITPTPRRVRHETRLRHVEVRRTETLSPRLRRIVFGGDDLADFVTAAPDDHVKLFFPVPGEPGRTVKRDYTPRRFDPQARELAIEFVLHGDGPAAAWAAAARPGDALNLGGPRGSYLEDERLDAHLLVGDETALPSIARRLEEMRPGARALVLIEVADAAEERHLPSAASTTVVWVHGRTSLADALAARPLPPGDLHAWLAGETDTIRALRAHLVEVRGIPHDRIRAAGYWRRGVSDSHERIS